MHNALIVDRSWLRLQASSSDSTIMLQLQCCGQHPLAGPLGDLALRAADCCAVRPQVAVGPGDLAKEADWVAANIMLTRLGQVGGGGRHACQQCAA